MPPTPSPTTTAASTSPTSTLSPRPGWPPAAATPSTAPRPTSPGARWPPSSTGYLAVSPRCPLRQWQLRPCKLSAAPAATREPSPSPEPSAMPSLAPEPSVARSPEPEASPSRSPPPRRSRPVRNRAGLHRPSPLRRQSRLPARASQRRPEPSPSQCHRSRHRSRHRIPPAPRHRRRHAGVPWCRPGWPRRDNWPGDDRPRRRRSERLRRRSGHICLACRGSTWRQFEPVASCGLALILVAALAPDAHGFAVPAQASPTVGLPFHTGRRARRFRGRPSHLCPGGSTTAPPPAGARTSTARLAMARGHGPVPPGRRAQPLQHRTPHRRDRDLGGGWAAVRLDDGICRLLGLQQRERRAWR